MGGILLPMNHALLPQPNEIRGAQLPEVYNNAKLALAECNRIDECKDWGDKMQALASYAKQADDKEMEKTAMRIRGRAVRRCGELLKEIEKGHGQNQNIKGDAPPKVQTRKDAAKEAGLSPDQARQSIRLANVPEEEFEAQLESDNPPTLTALAEQGTKKAVPLYEKMGISKKSFQAGMYLGGTIKQFSAETTKYDPQDVVDGLLPEERKEIRKCIETIDAYLDQIIVKL